MSSSLPSMRIPTESIHYMLQIARRQTFWATIAPIYAGDSRVWFDLYNEPTADNPYSTWKNGDTTNGIVGMQSLVTTIRAVAPNNIILAESIDDFQHLQGIDNYTLSGGNIVYAVHPYFRDSSDGSNVSAECNFGF